VTNAGGGGVPRFLLNEDGHPFAAEIVGLRGHLEALSNRERETYRDENAAAIACHGAPRLLIIGGPGSGKSFLFRMRIKHWLADDGEAQIYVSSFVRKLVHDLEAEIANDRALVDEDRTRLTVSTLHTLARSLVERSGGTRGHPLLHHVQVIGGEWESMVWEDVLRFRPDLKANTFTRTQLDRQFHTEELDDSPAWQALRDLYGRLGRFYNAVGFAHMILLARQAVDEKPGLSEHLLWIVDEYQDFNAAEDHLIRSLTARVHGVLIAGDDEQALYQELKSSLPDIIISYYHCDEFANGMLPFSTRCSYYVCLVASAFIQHHRMTNAIDKVILPLKIEPEATKVQVVGTFQPSTAVDYIAQFIESRRVELDAHIEKMRRGEELDPFLLVLTPEKTAKFYRDHRADRVLRDLLSAFAVVPTGRSPDYRRTATYCTVAWEPTNNFAVRKALHYEGISSSRVHELLERALSEGRQLSDLVDEDVITALLAVGQAVGHVVQDDSLDSVAKSTALAALISVEDQEQLASELAADSIGILDNLAEEEAQEAIETAGDVASVEMMTMFRSKGLSARHVIIIGCDDVNLRRTAALTFYVGMTRARESLHLITSLRAGGSTRAADYVLELPSEFCDYIEYRKMGHRSIGLRDRQSFIDLLARWSRTGSRSRR
jgi:superfamily I DNA/RNA helicase